MHLSAERVLFVNENARGKIEQTEGILATMAKIKDSRK
jgi:hypothetical protein